MSKEKDQSVLALATAALKKDEKEVKIEAIKDAIAENKITFSTAKLNIEREIRGAEKYLASLASDPTASPFDILDAQDSLEVAKDQLARIEAVGAVRFGE